MLIYLGLLCPLRRLCYTYKYISNWSNFQVWLEEAAVPLWHHNDSFFLINRLSEEMFIKLDLYNFISSRTYHFQLNATGTRTRQSVLSMSLLKIINQLLISENSTLPSDSQSESRIFISLWFENADSWLAGDVFLCSLKQRLATVRLSAVQL